MALVPTELDKPVVYESGWYDTDVVYVCTLIYIYIYIYNLIYIYILYIYLYNMQTYVML